MIDQVNLEHLSILQRISQMIRDYEKMKQESQTFNSLEDQREQQRVIHHERYCSFQFPRGLAVRREYLKFLKSRGIFQFPRGLAVKQQAELPRGVRLFQFPRGLAPAEAGAVLPRPKPNFQFPRGLAALTEDLLGWCKTVQLSIPQRISQMKTKDWNSKVVVKLSIPQRINRIFLFPKEYDVTFH